MRLLVSGFVAVVISGVSAVAIAGQTASPAGSVPKITRFQRGLHGSGLSITAGPGRSLWFTEAGSPGTIGRVTTRGVISLYRAGIHCSMYGGSAPITAGRDGDIWFGESCKRASAIGRITPRGRVREFRRGITGGVSGLAAGPDGNVWFTESSCGRRGCRGAIGRITPLGAVTTFTRGLHGGNQPAAITAGPDGNLWFTEDPSNPLQGQGLIGRITPQGAITEFDNPAPSASSGMTVGPDGKLYMTDLGSIVSAAPRPDPGNGRALAAIRYFQIGRPRGFIEAVTAGPDKAVWFAAVNDTGYAKVGRISTTSGRVQRFGSRLGSAGGTFLLGIAAGPDGNIWFTEGDRAPAKPSIDRLRLAR